MPATTLATPAEAMRGVSSSKRGSGTVGGGAFGAGSGSARVSEATRRKVLDAAERIMTEVDNLKKLARDYAGSPEGTLRLATTHGIRLAVKVVDAVYNMSGATAAYDGNPIQRYFQDVHVISQHLQARLAHYELVGRHWLGLKVDETRL